MGSYNFHENLTEFDEIKTSSNRSFGITFTTVFIIIALLPLLKHHTLSYGWLFFAVAMLLITFTSPNLLTVPNKIWTRFGLLLGKVMTPIIIGIMFFIMLTPIALILRCLGKDLLKLRLQASNQSYWILRSPPGPEPESLHQQF